MHALGLGRDFWGGTVKGQRPLSLPRLSAMMVAGTEVHRSSLLVRISTQGQSDYPQGSLVHPGAPALQDQPGTRHKAAGSPQPQASQNADMPKIKAGSSLGII